VRSRIPIRVSLAALAGLSAALAVAGCATSANLTNLWKDPEVGRNPMRSAYVVAMDRDAARRRIMEDAFVAALAKHGVEAEPSYRQFPSSVPDSNVIEDAIQQGGYDGVIAISRLDPRTQTTYVPGYVSSETRTRYNRWTGRYRTYWVDIPHPGYVETDHVVRRQVDLWRPVGAGGEADLVWTAVSEVVDPSSATDVTKDLVNRVVPELAKQGMVPKS